MTTALSLQKVMISFIALFCICFALFLGYIDEGYYNFQFLLEPGSIFVLFIYAAITSIPALLVYGLGRKFKVPKEVLFPASITALFVFPVVLFLLIF